MVTRRHRELHEFVRERADETYRAAFHYDEDGWETIHVRGDLASRELHDAVSNAVERAQETTALIRETDYPPLGEATATTEIHEDGVLLHFPEGSEAGTVVSLDRDAARRLTGFVVTCTDILSSAESTWTTRSGD